MKKDKTVRDVVLDSEPIELCKLLKLENMVGSGGEAKMAISSELVRVNGAVELRKAKKIRFGDVVEFGGEKIRLVGPGQSST